METVNIKDVPLDIRQQKFVSVGDFYQNDTNIIKFTLSDNSNPADLSNVDEILINYKRPDGEIISRLLEAESNIINYQLGQSEMQVVGLGKLVLQFFSNDKRLSTFVINVSVKKSIETNFEFEEGENPLADQLFEKMNTFNNRLDNLVIEGGGGDGSLVFQTLSDLQNEFPNGTSQPVWIISEKSWYYWSGGNVEPQPDTIPPILTITSGGNFTNSKIITMNTNETATIFYTLNGSTPTVNSSIYTSAITLSATTTLKAFARDTAGNSSAIQTIVYTLVVPNPGDITPPNNVTNLQVTNNTTGTSLTLTWTASTSNDVSGYEVYRGTTLLTIVTGNSYNVTGLTANTSYTFMVKAKDSSNNVASGTSVTATAVIVDDAAPILTITPSTTFTDTQTVTMTTNETATIYYTLDGTTPTQTSLVYSAPLTLSATTTLKAFAKDTAGNSSDVQTVVYTKGDVTFTALHLQGAGHLSLPIVVHNRVVLDFTFVARTGQFNYIYDARPSLTDVFAYVYSATQILTLSVKKTFTSLYINGEQIPIPEDMTSTPIANGDRVTVDITHPSNMGTKSSALFAKPDGTTRANVKVHDVKLYSDSTLVTHVDMTTGTLNDQTGNNNHIQLVGLGDWI